jgi:sugar lactone lactonase YvrE
MKHITLILIALTSWAVPLYADSYYPIRPEDPRAVYFTKDQFDIHADGENDDSDALQEAINNVSRSGIVFIPEGRYRLAKTVIVWSGIRLIGYGAERPVFVLTSGTPGFQWGTGKYMFHFAGNRPMGMGRGTERGMGNSYFSDASEVTFYSGMDNIDIEIQEGNLAAIAIRFHVAQHSYLRHMDFHIGSARAAVEDIGNQISNINVYGGKYGIITKRTSPVWQFLLMDSHFEGQSEAGIQTMEAGFTMVRVSFENMPVAVQITLGEVEQLYGRDLQMKNIGWAGFKHGNAENLHSEVTFTNVACSDVPTFYRGGEMLKAPSQHYVMDKFTVGLEIGRDGREQGVMMRHQEHELSEPAPAVATDIPELPPMSEWGNVHTIGVVGDGRMDDTQAIKAAIEEHKALYFPMGSYRVSEPIELKQDTVIIGLHPGNTSISMQSNVVGEGKPAGVIIAPKGGKNIVSSISVSPGSNPSAAGVLWMADPDSMLDDVSFSGGGGFGRRSGARGNGPDLMIIDGGGGIFRGNWPHGTSSSLGLYIENTSTKGKIYQMSVEHHMQVELILRNVENWEFYALQTEEENPAGHEANAMHIENCRNILFANTYMYRVSRSIWPMTYGIIVRNSDNIKFENVKVFSQTRLAFDTAVYDEDSGVTVRPQFFTSFVIKKDMKAPGKLRLSQERFENNAKLEKLATGFRNATGLTTDSEGHLFFSDDSNCKVYRWNAADKKAELITETPDQTMVMAYVEPSTLLMVGRGSSVYSLNLAQDGATPQAVEGVSENLPNTELLIPLGLHNMMSVLDDLMEHRDYIYRRGSNTAVISIIENAPRSYFYAPGTKIAVKTGGTWRPLVQSSNIGEFSPDDKFYVTSEDDGKTYRVKLNKNETLSYYVFAERGGTSVIEDAAGNVYIASDQVYIYNSQGKQIGILELPERPGSFAFGGPDNRTLFIGARSSVYSIRTVNPGQ